MRIILGCLALALWCGVQSASAQDAPKHDERIQKLLDKEGIKYEIDSDGDFKLVYEVGEAGRTQLAFIRSHTETYRNLEIREIWSPAYKSDAETLPSDIANMLLEDNAKKKLGAWQKQGQHAVFVTQIPADADFETVLSALKAALETADAIEEQLTGATDAF